MNCTVLPVVAALCGAAVGGLIGFFGTWMNNLVNARRIAVNQFRFAFSPEIAALMGPTRVESVRDILVAGFNRHNEAIVNFRHFLNRRTQPKFDEAWKDYYGTKNLDPEKWSIPTAERLFIDCFSIQDESEAASIYIEKIHKLFEFAK
jgi:hypothetical protein